MTSTKPSRHRAAKKQPDFWWWDPSKSQELAHLIMSHPGSRLEMRMKGVDVFFRMANGDVSTQIHHPGHTDLNDSHACPPSCP